MDGWLVRQTDWKEIGMELRRHGWGATRVAEHLNLPRSTVRGWFEENAEPGYHSGMQLIRLHNLVVSFRASTIRPAWQATNCL